MLRERVVRRDVIFMTVLAAGLALFFVDAPERRRHRAQPMLGNILAVISGVGWAGTVMGLRWLGRREGTDCCRRRDRRRQPDRVRRLPAVRDRPRHRQRRPATGYGSSTWASSRSAWRTSSSRGPMPHLRALEVSLLLYVEPALNPIWSWLAHGETVGALSIAAG